MGDSILLKERDLGTYTCGYDVLETTPRMYSINQSTTHICVCCLSLKTYKLSPTQADEIDVLTHSIILTVKHEESVD